MRSPSGDALLASVGLMAGQDQTERSVLLFLKFVGDLQSTEKPMHHQALVILTEMW